MTCMTCGGSSSTAQRCPGVGFRGDQYDKRHRATTSATLRAATVPAVAVRSSTSRFTSQKNRSRVA
jgi:hypothetical protein